MAFITPCHELTDLGGRARRLLSHLAPVAYWDGPAGQGGNLREIINTWLPGDQTWPNLVTAAPLMTYVADDSLRRLCPTRDPQVYLEIGAPYVKSGGTWTKVDLGQPTRSANLLTWTKPNYNAYIFHAGHFSKLAILLKNGFTPEDNQIAFPVGASGLVRDGLNFYLEGSLVAYVRPMFVYDYANPEDQRHITTDIVNLSGQAYALLTLPSLAGMAQPIIDPTLTLQPDASAGVDLFCREAAPTTNYGVNPHMEHRNDVGGRRQGYIKFDVSAASGGTVTAATFSIWHYFTSTTTRTFYYYAILAANAAWSESATWNTRDGSNPWAGDADEDGGTDAGCSVSGTDYNAASIGNAPVPANDPAEGQTQASLSTSAVQDWVDGYNYGLLSLADWASTDRGYYSSDETTEAYRPKLVVEYTTGGSTVSKSFAIPFDIRNLAAKSLAAPFDVRNLVAKSLAAPFDVRNLAAKSLAAPWDLRNTAVKSLALPWDLRNAAAKSLTIPWAMGGQVRRSLVLPWSIRRLFTSRPSVIKFHGLYHPIRKE